MVKHIVLFQLDAAQPDERRRELMRAFRAAILALPARIPFIRRIEVEFNVNPDEKYDIALYSEFGSLDEVCAYAAHPDHVAAAAIIKPYIVSRACTDYAVVDTEGPA